MYDSKLLNTFKSIYLSGSRLPNLLQTTKFNDSRSKRKCKITDEEINNAIDICINRGYLYTIIK